MEHAAEQVFTIVRGGGGYARVNLDGHLDHHVARRLRTQLGAVLDAGARYLTVDLSEVDSCDEDVLDVLGWAASRASSQQGWLALTGGRYRLRFAAR